MGGENECPPPPAEEGFAFDLKDSCRFIVSSSNTSNKPSMYSSFLEALTISWEGVDPRGLKDDAKVGMMIIKSCGLLDYATPSAARSVASPLQRQVAALAEALEKTQ